MKPTELAAASGDLAEYCRLCARMRFEPTDAQLEAMKAFILLFNSGTATLCESDVAHFDARFDALLEGHGGDYSFFDGGYGGHGGGGAGGVASAAAVKLQSFVEYLFKRPKLVSLFKEEMRHEMEKLDLWVRIVTLKRKIAEAKGEKPDYKLNYPRITGSPASASPTSAPAPRPAPRPASKPHAH